MTVLSAIRAAAPKIGVAQPSSVFSSIAQEHVELAALAQEVAERIAEAHDWQALKRLHSITGNGEATNFDLPPSYERMPIGQELRTSVLECALHHVIDHDEWLDLQVRSYETATGAWTIIGNQIAFYPALDDGEVVQLYYMTDLIVETAAGDLSTSFTADADTFRLDERLLTLGMIWQMKADKGKAYAEDMQTFEMALAQKIARDKGARMLHIGTPTLPRGVRVAYPKAISV
jgi:hypothetical protein